MYKMIQRSALVIIFLFLIVKSGATAQTAPQPNTPDWYAQRTVLIAVYGDGKLLGTGSGVVADPSGIIFTNRHVVEGGQDFAVYMVEGVSSPPALKYYATVYAQYTQPYPDFAILQINRDAKGQLILPGDLTNLNLPFIAPSPATEVKPDDEIIVYGFPGILMQPGQANMSVTRGRVISTPGLVTTGLPEYYVHDAVASGGNSGGLVVNGNGEFIGLLTGAYNADNRYGIIQPLKTAFAVQQNGGQVASPVTVVESPELPLGKIIVSSGNWDIDANIHIIDSNGALRLNLTPNDALDNDYGATFCRTGQEIVYLSTINENRRNDLKDSEIWTMNADGSNRDQVTDTDDWEDHPAFSPDCLKIAYMINGNLYIMNRDGSNSQELSNANTDSWEGLPRYSPDGTKIAYISWKSGSQKVCFIDSGGLGQPTCPIDAGNHKDTSPIGWSPDSAYIVFASNEGKGSEVYERDIFIASVDGTRVQNLTGDLADDPFNPVWSQDGSTIIYFDWTPEDGGQAYKLDLQTGRIKVVSSGPNDWYGDAWFYPPQ